jgi:preprotein translocase subunit SecF
MINLNIIKNRKIWLGFSGTLVALSLVAIFVWGLKFGIFHGEVYWRFNFRDKQLSAVEIREGLQDLNLNILSPKTESNSVILLLGRFEDVHQICREKIGSWRKLKNCAMNHWSFYWK